MDNDLRIVSGSVSDRGLSEKRRQNEDSFLELNHCGVYAVADGVGGAEGGEVASQMAMEILAEAFTNKAEGADVEDVMRTAIERANGAIHQMAQELPQLWSMATTIVALHIAGNIATIGHVGDSRLYRVDRDGALYRETDDHSMVADEVRAGRMTEQQAENHPSRNIISRALGAEPTVDVDLKTMMIEPGNAFLLCSDGITRHVTDQEIKGVLTFGGEPIEICEYLKGLCYERGAEDNLTAVVVKAGVVTRERGEQLASIEDEEDTVATARSPFDSEIDDDDQLLELDTVAPTVIDDDADYARVFTDTDEFPFPDKPAEKEVEEEVVMPAAVDDGFVEHNRETPFSMFGDSGESVPEESTSGSLGKILSAVGLLLLGSVIGLGAYHFFLVPSAQKVDAIQLSEMRAANIPQSTFEENRRNVDKDPTGYIAKFGAYADDSEDYYLLGRAYLLTRDYQKARTAFTESRNRLPGADPANAKILSSDIAMGMAVTNDTTIQGMLNKEFDAGGNPPANANMNANR